MIGFEIRGSQKATVRILMSEKDFRSILKLRMIWRNTTVNLLHVTEHSPNMETTSGTQY